MYCTWCAPCSTEEDFLCQKKSSCRFFYPTCPQGILLLFFCSLNSQSFLLTPSINIYAGSHLILPYASSLKLLFKSLSASTAESSDTLPQHKVFEEIFPFFPLLLLMFSLSICYLVFFTLWFNILNHLKQKSTFPTNLETIFCIDSISPETVLFFFFPGQSVPSQDNRPLGSR